MVPLMLLLLLLHYHYYYYYYYYYHYFYFYYYCCCYCYCYNWMEYEAKFNEKYKFQGLKDTATHSFISCYQLPYQQISFSWIFRTLFNIFWKKIFVTNFSFLMYSPTLLTAKICQGWQKFFCRGYLVLYSCWHSIVLYQLGATLSVL